MSTIKQFRKHHSQTRLIPCLRVKDSIMNDIEKELLTLVKNFKISENNTKKHGINFTKPYGSVTQSCLFNTTGNLLDFSTDYQIPKNDKFFFEPNYKNIHNIFKLFQDNIINFWLFGMSKNSGLSPHKVIRNKLGRKIRCRFHLPVITNSSAWVMLDWKKFWLKRGIIYFFNDGCVHTAGNGGDATRYHLVWDCNLDFNLFDNILNVENSYNPNPNLVSKISEKEIKDLLYSEPCKITDYEIEQVGLGTRLMGRLKAAVPSFSPNN